MRFMFSCPTPLLRAYLEVKRLNHRDHGLVRNAPKWVAAAQAVGWNWMEKVLFAFAVAPI